MSTFLLWISLFDTCIIYSNFCFNIPYFFMHKEVVGLMKYPGDKKEDKFLSAKFYFERSVI